MPLNNPSHTVLEAKKLVESDRRSEIRLNANGGNSVLIICDPMQELSYITEINKLLPKESYQVIDLNQCLIDFTSLHQQDLDELYNQLQSATHEIFKAPAGEQSPDLFKEIIKQIETAYESEKIPVLISTGALYGTGIHNIHIMEHDAVMKAPRPLLILYPATVEPDRIMFLSKHPASKYRCMILN